MEPVIRCLAIVWYLIYLAIAIYGCLQLREGLEPVNLLVEDSYAIPHYHALEHYFWHYGAACQVVIRFFRFRILGMWSGIIFLRLGLCFLALPLQGHVFFYYRRCNIFVTGGITFRYRGCNVFVTWG